MLLPHARLRRRWWAIALLLAAAGCNGLLGSDDDDTRVRLLNASEYELIDVHFSSGHDPLLYGAIQAGGMTTYVAVPRAYRIASLEASVDNVIYTVQPIDFVGEEPLRSGRYTYVITFTPQAGLTLSVSRDR